MVWLGTLLKRLADPKDRVLLEHQPSLVTRLRVIARIARRYYRLYIVVFLASLIVTVVSGMDVYHRTELPQFCGACHEMGSNFKTWEESRHKSIMCVDCHVKPGISGWLEAKTGGLRQLVTHFTAETIDEIAVNEEQARTVSNNCKRCHAGATRLQERDGLGMAHGRHGEVGILCSECHSGAFAHPESNGDPRSTPPLVDSATCFECHDGRTRADLTIFKVEDQASCVRCHPDAELGNQHGAGDNECFDCHSKSEEGVHYEFAADNVAPMCAECHDDVTDLVELDSTHEPFAEGNCLKCHRVMSPAHIYMGEAKPTAAACLACHEETAALLAEDPKAPVSRFNDDGDDLHTSHAAELREQRGWCLRCHSPHASEAKKGLIRLLTGKEDDEEPGVYEALPDGGSCATKCHVDEDPVTYTNDGGR